MKKVTGRSIIEGTDFLEDNWRALTSIDRMPWAEAKQEIEGYFEKWGASIPASDEALLRAVHQQRLTLLNLPEEQKDQSRQWLAEH